MASGLTPTGFVPKTLEEIKTDLENAYKSIFGNDVVLTPSSPQGQEIGIWANIASLVWQQQLNLYNQFNPNSATGVSLDQLVQLNGLERKDATNTVVTATLTGTNGTIIPQGSLASTVAGNQFESDEEVTIPVSGTIDTLFSSVETGEIPAGAGTLTIIDSPIDGWDTITNVADGVLGAHKETNGALRERRRLSVSLPASNIIDSLYAQLFATVGVNDAVIFNNPTNSESPEGIPAHRYLTIVDGGLNEDIAQAIYLNHTSGDKSFGDIEVFILSSRGLMYQFNFQDLLT